MENLHLTDVPFESDIRVLMRAFDYYPEVYGRYEDGAYIFTINAGVPDNQITFTVTDDNSERFKIKSDIKRELYKILSKATGKELPWGTLTGIRPTKLAMKGLDFKKEFLTSDEKISLCFETAEREKHILDKIDYENGWSLYIGIPFCPTTCLYCSFTSYPIAVWKKKVDDYVAALCREIKEVCKMQKNKKLQTIYIGGGTPTSLGAAELKLILDTVRESADLSHLLELTCEAGRPDSITGEKLEVLKESGVTRISINPQTMNDDTLKLIGRFHTVDMVKEKFQLARELGFDNINMDIIVGLPCETLDNVKHTLYEIEKLGPDEVTVHTLAIKHSARLNHAETPYEHTDFGTICDMLDLSRQVCSRMNLHPYYLYRQKQMAGNMENVGYAREGKEGIYNILIMEEKQTIVGCGAGSSTKIPIGDKGVTRVENVKDPGVYIDRIEDMIARKRDELWH